MNITVEPNLTSDPALADVLQRANRLLEKSVSTYDSPVTAVWRHLDGPEDVELTMSDQEGAMGKASWPRKELLRLSDLWLGFRVRNAWGELLARRSEIERKRLRQSVTALEETEDGEN